MSKRKRTVRKVSPVDDAKAFIALVASTKPLFLRDTPVERQYELLGLDPKDGVATTRLVVDELYRRIAQELPPAPSAKQDLRKLEKHLWLRYLVDDLQSLLALDVVDVLKDATRVAGWPCPDLDWPGWPKVTKWARTYLEVRGREPDPFHFKDPRTKAVGLAAKELRTAGFAVQVRGDRIDTAPYEERLHAALDRFASTVGGLNLATLLFEDLRSNFDSAQNRYHVVRKPQSSGLHMNEPLAPYGYLLSLAVKHIDAHPKSDASDAYRSLRKLSAAYATVYDVQPHVSFDGMFNDRSSILRYLQEIAAFDSLYTFAQCNPGYVPSLLSRVLNTFDSERTRAALGASAETVVACARALLEAPSQGPMLWRASDVARAAAIPESEAALGLAALTHPKPPNSEFLDPLGSHLARFWEFPLLRLDEGYLLVDAAHCAPAFYEAVASRLRSERLPRVEENIGAVFEKFAFDLLAEHRLEVHSGNYDSSVGAGECDAVVETPTAVVFIEFKKKCLTRRARSAHADAILTDLVCAMLDPHCQTGRHELALTADGQLKLIQATTSYVLNLDGRPVERLAISLPEFGAFHSREVSSQVLNLFTGANVSSSTLSTDALEKINRTCKALADNYARAKDLGITEPERYFNCWFLGLDALYTLLANVDSGDAFWRELKRTRHVSTGSLSWHYDYAWARKLDRKFAATIDSTGSRVIVG